MEERGALGAQQLVDAPGRLGELGQGIVGRRAVEEELALAPEEEARSSPARILAALGRPHQLARLAELGQLVGVEVRYPERQDVALPGQARHGQAAQLLQHRVES